MVVKLAFATKKRHIAIDEVVLCEPKHKTAGYSVKNGQYNTLSLSGLPDYERKSGDMKRTHTDGIIPLLPLNEQPFLVIESSVCAKCKSRYEKLLKTGKRTDDDTAI